MKITQKITLGFILLVSLFSSVLFLAWRGNCRARANLEELVLEGEKNGLLLNKVQKRLGKIEVLSYQFLHLKERQENSEKVAGKKKEILKNLAQLKDSLRELDFALEKRVNYDREQIESHSKKVSLKDEIDLAKILEKLKIDVFQMEQILKTILDEEEISPKEKILLAELDYLFDSQISPLLNQYQSNLFSDQLEKKAIIEESLTDNEGFIRYGTLIGLLFSLGLVLYLLKIISAPIGRLKRASIQVKKGNFDVQVQRSQNDELGILIENFNEMILELKNITVSKDYLDNILASLNDSLIMIDSQGKIKKVNQNTCELLGYSESELTQMKIDSILVDSSLNIEVVNTRKNLQNYEVNYLTKEGKKISVLLSTATVLDHSGMPTGRAFLSRDITEKKQIQKALQQSEERYALAAMATNDGLWDWNIVSNTIYFSPRWKSLLGYEADDNFENTPEQWFNRIHPDYVEGVTQEIIAHLHNNNIFESNFEISYPILHQNGNFRWMLCRGIKVTNSENKIHRIIGSQTDITHLRKAEEQLEYQSLYDGLTGLPNRVFIFQKITNLLQLASLDSQTGFAVLLIDLDRFKKINESLGHLIGDEVLIEFSNRIKIILESEATFARLGADEFIILIENITDSSDAIKLVKTIIRQLDKPFYLKGIEIFINVSIGVAFGNTNTYEQIDELIRDAETAMNRAKAKGKGNYYVVFAADMHLESLSSLELENDLRRAIENTEFIVFYQPILELKNSQIVGFEALVRWQHPQKGMIPPGQFIPLAEETGQIVQIGYWVMEKACSQMRLWQEKYQVARNMTISVNLSPLQLTPFLSNYSSLNCLEKIKQILEKTAIKPSSLKLEITETTLIQSLQETKILLAEIKDLGIKLSMDDFGTGYSSLNYLNDLPIDTLKIDRSFIKSLCNNPEKLELIKTIINLAHNLNLETVAEGIETQQQQALLAKLNCEYGQGYLFSKPVSQQDAEILIAINNRLKSIIS